MTDTQGRRIILTLGESRVVGTERDSDKEGYFAVLADAAIGAPSLFSVHDGWTVDYPIEVPTKPYAVIAPPAKNERDFSACVLEPFSYPGLTWQQFGSDLTIEEVADKLANGWRVVFEGVGD